MCRVIWYSQEDGSFGACDCHDLIVVKESDLTADEFAFLDEASEAGDEHAIATVLSSVRERANA